MKILYRLYQLFIAAPLLILATATSCIITMLGCTLGKARFWSYYPPMIWSRLMCWLLLLPVEVEGQDLLEKHQSYVFVANHQGAFDIFLIYGFLGRSFRWMMKKSLRQVPLVGKASESAGHIFVDKSGPKAIRRTYEQARQVLQGGISLVVFPEGARSLTGHMRHFRRGAFLLADELGLPIVPMTIDGSFDVLPRQRGFGFVHRHRLRLVIHAPILSVGKGPEAVQHMIEQSQATIMQDLPQRHQGIIEHSCP